MNTPTISSSDKTKLFDDAAKALFVRLAKVDGPSIILGLVGGRSVVGLLEAMARGADQLPRTAWARLQVFMVDERVVPLTDADSNFRVLSEALLGKLVEGGYITEEQLHPFRMDERTPDFGAGAYRDEFANFGGRYHAVVLAIGEDGHAAGLFPKHSCLDRQDQPFLTFTDSPKPPAHRMTASVTTITQADFGILLAVGEGKRQAFERFKDPEVPFHDCPSKLIEKIADRIVVTDIL